MLQQVHGRWNTSHNHHGFQCFLCLNKEVPVHISILKIFENRQALYLKQTADHTCAEICDIDMLHNTQSLCSNIAINHLYPQIPKLNEAAESEFNLIINFAGGWITTCTCCPGHKVFYVSFDHKKKKKTKGEKTLNKQVTEYLQIFSVDLFSHLKMYS